jgi:hypothetical protein
MKNYKKYLFFIFRSIGHFRGGLDFWGHALYSIMVKQFFSQYKVYGYKKKNTELYVDFININLTYCKYT